jgi:hypothetical protein
MKLRSVGPMLMTDRRGDEAPLDGLGAPPIAVPQREALRGRNVTDRMIDYVWPCLYFVLGRHGDPSSGIEIQVTDFVPRPQDLRTVKAFLALMEEDLAVDVTVELLLRGVTEKEANRTAQLFYQALAAWAQRANSQAVRRRPRGRKGDIAVRLAVGCAYAAWRREHGTKPRVSATGPFTAWCMAIGDLIGVEITRDKIRRVVEKSGLNPALRPTN